MNEAQAAKRPPVVLKFTLALVLAVVASASTWFYMDGILRTQQIADAAAQGTPRGNLSDLYPRWLGARELLLRGRNPYSPEMTREIQRGYYGRPLDPRLPGDHRRLPRRHSCPPAVRAGRGNLTPLPEPEALVVTMEPVQAAATTMPSFGF